MDGVHRKMGRYPIDAIIIISNKPKVMILDLIIEFFKIRDVDNLKSLCEKCLYMKPSTIFFMLELEQCVEHIKKFRFVSIY